MPGGIGNHAFCLAKELSQLAYSVTIATEPREQNEGEWQTFLKSHDDLNIISIHRHRILFFTYFLRIFIIYNLIRKNSYKAVIYSGKFSVWLNGIMLSTKSLVVIHGSEIKQKGISRFLFYRGLKKASKIICVSEYTKTQLILSYPEISEKKICVINNGIKNDWTTPQPINKRIDQSKLALITVGGIHKRKGQFNVVRALPNIIKFFPQTKYYSIGLPVEKKELLNLIIREKVENHVNFHHGLNDDQVRKILKDAHVFIMLSEHLKNGDFEGFGIAILEAMALGLPAIGSQNSGIADAIKDKYSGRLVDPQNPAEITSALKEIINDYGQYSANAKSWAESFKWQHKIKEYQNLIDRL
jgi:phosphatidylinositol alpha-1,6-mannosyltransferase